MVIRGLVRRSQRFAGAAPSAVAAAVAAVAVALLAGACSHTTQQSVTVTPAALVAKSAQATLSQKTADITLSGNISAAGHQIPIAGTGAANFTSQLMSLDLKATVSGMSFDIKELVASGKLYMSGTFGGSSFSALTGKDWISLPVPTSAQSLYGSDPFAQLKVLEQQGAAVTPLGQKTLDGRTVTGYSIVPTKASMIKAAEEELPQLGLDQSQTSQIQSAIQQTQPPTFTIWVDSSHLLRQMSMALDTGGAMSGVTADIEMTVTHYGVPVNVTAPSPSDVVSFQQFMQDAQKAGSSGG